MSDDDDEPSWHDEHSVVVAAGVAGLVLLALLAWAVIRTSHGSQAPDTAPLPASSETSSTYTTSSTTSTSYTVPSVQTSQDNPALTTTPEATPSSESEDDETTTLPTTTNDPYVTTSPPNAGFI